MMSLGLVGRGVIALSESVNRYFRVLKGVDAESIALRLPGGGPSVGYFEVRHSATNVALLHVDDSGVDLAPGAITTPDIGDGQVTSVKIADGTIVDGDINAAAGIQGSKLLDSSVTSAKIADGTLVNADVSAAAAIAYGKLNLATSIVNADIAPSGTAQINPGKLNAGGTANRVLVTTDGVLGLFGQVSSAMIADGTILDADINATANINGSKLADGTVTSAKLSGGIPVPAGSITNAEISATAGIVGTKLANATIGPAQLVSHAAGELAVVNFAATSTASTVFAIITGSTISITGTGRPLQLGVTLQGLGLVAGTSFVQVSWWQDGANVLNAVFDDMTTVRRTVSAMATITPPVGAHSYFVAWLTTAGTLSCQGGSIWALEVK